MENKKSSDISPKAFFKTNKDLDDKLHYGLGISFVALSHAEKYSNGNTNEFIDRVYDWLKDRPENAMDECKYPPKNWVSNLISYFTFTEKEKSIIMIAEQNGKFTYPLWKDLVLQMIKRLKDHEIPASFQDNLIINKPPAFSSIDDTNKLSKLKKSIFMNPKMPLDMMDTRCLDEAKRLSQNSNLFQMYGARGMGKRYILTALLNELEQQVDHIFVFNLNTTHQLLHDQVKRVILKLAKHDWISTQERNNLANKETLNALLLMVKILSTQGIKAILVFSISEFDLSSNFTPLLQSFVHEILKQCEEFSVKTILVTSSRDAILDQATANLYSDCFPLVEIDGFTPLEANKYLSLNLGPKNLAQIVLLERYLEESDGSKTVIVNPFSNEGAKRICLYFDYNPCCLKAAKEYCITRKILYSDYANSMDQSPCAQRFIHAVSAQILKESSVGNVEAYMSINGMQNEHLSVYKCSVQQVLHVIMFLANEEIPVLIIEHICQKLRILNSNENYTEADHAWLNVNEASDIIFQLIKNYSCGVDSPILHPSGVINKIPQRVFDAELRATKKNTDQQKQSLVIAIQVILGMINKDNRESTADRRLGILINHIEKLTRNAKMYLELKLDLRALCSEDFFIFMGICRLLEVLGQGIIQDRLNHRVNQALQLLMRSATMLMDVMSAYKNSNGLLCLKLLFKTPTDCTELIGFPDLDIIENKDKEARKRAKKIAELCLETSKNLRPKIIDEYLRSTLILSAKNFEEFERKVMKTKNLSLREAKLELEDVAKTVKLKLGLTKQHIDQLRSMGNLLQAGEYVKIIFAERLSGIFHTYGRASHYNHSNMDAQEIRKCEYYCILSRQIAEQIRLLSKIGLINEYLPKAAAVAKSIQNIKNEADQDRIKRLDKAYKECCDLLVVPGTFYEDGKFREVEGSVYTELHAYRCMVKANTKIVKLREWNAWSNDNQLRSLNECDKLLQLTLNSKSLDMAPHCLIQSARFYAAAGDFVKAFEVYEKGFHQTDESGTYGISQLTDKRPNSYAWAVYNYCYSLKIYMERADLAKHNLDILKLKANKRLEATLLNPKVDKSWKESNGKLQKFKTIFV